MEDNNILVNVELAKLIDLVGPENMAKHLRRGVYLITRYALVDGAESVRPSWVPDTIHFLTEMAECMHPVLEDN